MFASVEIRVSNFGSAAKIPCTTACEYTPAGSTGYRAPELCAGTHMSTQAQNLY